MCGYQAKTISKKVRSYAHVDMNFLGVLPRFPTLSDFLKGYKYLFQHSHHDKTILSFEAQRAFNGALDYENNILENCFMGADMFASVACARSAEYLYKRSLDHGRSTAQHLTLTKLSDPFGRSLGLDYNFKIVERIKFWYTSKYKFIRVRLYTHKSY